MSGMDRRTFLKAVGRAGVVSYALGAWRRARDASAASEPAAPPEMIERCNWPEHYETTLAALGRSWLTRTDRFFVRSHLPPPTIDLDTYRLEIGGLVKQPLSLTLEEIKSLPAREMTCVLECAGNGRAVFPLASTSGTQWERGAVGNATWTGAELAFLLRRAEPLPEGKHVWFEAADVDPLPEAPRFLRSIPIEKALDDTLIAYGMNGEVLTRLHGAPLRAIVPGWYGMASTKWLTKVRVEAAPSDNHFMAKGYRFVYPGEDPSQAPPVDQMRVKSVITRPLEGSKQPLGKVRIQGFAWARAGVRLVEVSVDRGKTWKPAGFMGDMQPNAWRAWATEFEWKSPVRIQAMARATDNRGDVQPIEARLNAGGYGNNSIHVVSFRVA
jgi:DMSO/TMAO reductase YedYZ molybdopterin-dependent catalytic subunit